MHKYREVKYRVVFRLYVYIYVCRHVDCKDMAFSFKCCVAGVARPIIGSKSNCLDVKDIGDAVYSLLVANVTLATVFLH